MITLVMTFYILVFIFALIGVMRGWAKELLVSSSVLVGMGIIYIFEDLVPFTRDLLVDGSITEFWFRTFTILFMVFFGYQAPRISRISQGVEKRDKIRDAILGFLFGALSGYMIFGCLWYYMAEAGYPFAPSISSPSNDPVTADTAMRLLNLFPPAILTGYWILVAVVLAFVFVLIVFI